MSERITDLCTALEESLARATKLAAAKRAADATQTPFERRCTVHLDGDKHETLLTECKGLFSIYCGCGWKAQDLRYEDAERAERAHAAQDRGAS